MTVKIGDFYRCTRSSNSGTAWFTENEAYEVVGFDVDGDPVLASNLGESPLGLPLNGYIWDFVHEPTA